MTHDAHHHHHPDPPQEELTVEKKLKTLLQHWISHNVDHADTYRDWAKKAAGENMADVAADLNDAADMTIRMNKTFEDALARMKGN